MKHISRAKFGCPLDHSVGVNNTIVAQLHVGSHHCERSHLHTFAQFRSRRNHCLRMNLFCAHFPALVSLLRSTITHIKVASVVRFSSTKAFARILHRSPFHARMSTSTRNWSPGSTGRRNFTSFIDARYSS